MQAGLRLVIMQGHPVQRHGCCWLPCHGDVVVCTIELSHVCTCRSLQLPKHRVTPDRMLQAGKVKEATATFTQAKAALPPGKSNIGAMRIQVRLAS